jgi:hypothetical protein
MAYGVWRMAYGVWRVGDSFINEVDNKLAGHYKKSALKGKIIRKLNVNVSIGARGRY